MRGTMRTARAFARGTRSAVEPCSATMAAPARYTCQTSAGGGSGASGGRRFSRSNRPTMLLSRPEEDGPIPDVGGIPIFIDPTLVRIDLPIFPIQITWHGFFTAVG